VWVSWASIKALKIISLEAIIVVVVTIISKSQAMILLVTLVLPASALAQQPSEGRDRTNSAYMPPTGFKAGDRVTLKPDARLGVTRAVMERMAVYWFVDHRMTDDIGKDALADNLIMNGGGIQNVTLTSVESIYYPEIGRSVEYVSFVVNGRKLFTINDCIVP